MIRIFYLIIEWILVKKRTIRTCLHESGHFCNRILFTRIYVDQVLNHSGERLQRDAVSLVVSCR